MPRRARGGVLEAVTPGEEGLCLPVLPDGLLRPAEGELAGEAMVAEEHVGDPLTLCHRLPTPVTLAEANQVLYRQRRDPDSLLRVLSVPTLEPDFRRRLEQRLRDATPG